jgi:hypothetical protein
VISAVVNVAGSIASEKTTVYSAESIFVGSACDEDCSIVTPISVRFIGYGHTGVVGPGFPPPSLQVRLSV